MKKIEFIIGFLVIICLVMGLTIFAVGNLATAQPTSNSLYNATIEAVNFFQHISSLLPILIIIAIVAIIIIAIVFFARMFKPKWIG